LAGIFTGKFEFQFFVPPFLRRLTAARIWMFVPSLIVGNEFVLCQGE